MQNGKGIVFYSCERHHQLQTLSGNLCVYFLSAGVVEVFFFYMHKPLVNQRTRLYETVIAHNKLFHGCQIIIV